MRSEEILEKNKKLSEGFVQQIDNPKVPDYLRKYFNNSRVKKLIDLGCGDGIFVHAMKKEFPLIKITGVDISPRRIEGLRKKFPKDNFYCRDATDSKISEKFDFVYSSQVIEHVPSDKKMVDEIYRLLNSRGILFISSVIKKPFAVYKYRNQGKFVLDPTHVREYRSQENFLQLFSDKFELIKAWTAPVNRHIFGLKIKIPGYFLVFGIFQKK